MAKAVPKHATRDFARLGNDRSIEPQRLAPALRVEPTADGTGQACVSPGRSVARIFANPMRRSGGPMTVSIRLRARRNNSTTNGADAPPRSGARAFADRWPALRNPL